MDKHIINGEPLPETLAQGLPPARLQQVKEGIAALRGESAAVPDRTVKAHADAWLVTLQAQVAAGNLAADRVNNEQLSNVDAAAKSHWDLAFSGLTRSCFTEWAMERCERPGGAQTLP